MSQASVQIANERRKGLAGIAFNLGTALIAAAGASAYSESRFDPFLILWSLAAAVLIWVGWMILSLLESEA